MAPRNPCWRRYTPFSTWSGRSYSTAAGRALACTWMRKIVACERVCVGHVHTRALVERWRGEGGYLEYVSRYASLSCIGTSRVSLSSVETQRAGRVVSEVRLNWKFYSWSFLFLPVSEVIFVARLHEFCVTVMENKWFKKWFPVKKY